MPLVPHTIVPCCSALLVLVGAACDAEDAREDEAACPTVHLDCGAASFEALSRVTCAVSADDATGPWRWTIEQPAGSLAPVAIDAASATFEANVVGSYRVTVAPEALPERCAAVTSELAAVATDALYVELLWHTPGDPDETDTGATLAGPAGSDLDLHVRHASGTAWFEEPWDVSYANPGAIWSPVWSDRARLARKDNDGAGPEVFAYDDPRDVVYTIGVDYYPQDIFYGPAYARVRVYLEGALAFESEPVALASGDLWEVATIDWARRSVTAIGDGAPRITPDYEVPGP